jgi:hypothetical protein
MVLAYCKRCSFHELTKISGEEYSKCCKENCLSIYAKCLRFILKFSEVKCELRDVI